MNKNSLKNLKYGEPTKNHLRKMKKDSDLIGADPDLIRLQRPPENDSRESVAEILRIKKALEDNDYRNLRLIQLADEDPVGMFVSFAKKKRTKVRRRVYQGRVESVETNCSKAKIQIQQA